MFEKKLCSNCGRKIKDEWNFCPHCGEEIAAISESSDFFGGVSEEIDNEFERMDKMFGGFEDEKFRKPKMKGISIVIHGNPYGQPRIEVKSSDNYRNMEPETKRKLRVGPAVEEKKEFKERIQKFTEEPKVEVQNLGNKKIISIKLPDVKSQDDIYIKKLDQSIEVKAFSGDKAYFKLIPIPTNAVVNEDFKNGVLKIEIERS